jgi:hypothetical protein
MWPPLKRQTEAEHPPPEQCSQRAAPEQGLSGRPAKKPRVCSKMQVLDFGPSIVDSPIFFAY